MQIFDHRGSAWDHPEDTVEAFEAALADGATGIETDLRLCRDGDIVLVHDPDLRRVAHDARRVSHLTTNELDRVRIGESHRVPRLQELWELAAGRVRLNLEIKARGVARALAPLLAGRDADVLVTSSLATELAAVRELLPQVPTGPVLRRLGTRERTALGAGGYRAVSLSLRGFSPEIVGLCHALGAEILIWVVNDPGRVLDLAAAGVDGVFTDRPRLVASALHPR